MDESVSCLECGHVLETAGLTLVGREGGGRACRSLWKCSGGHIWWRWADQPDAVLEVCPLPQLFR